MAGDGSSGDSGPGPGSKTTGPWRHLWRGTVHVALKHFCGLCEKTFFQPTKTSCKIVHSPVMFCGCEHWSEESGAKSNKSSQSWVHFRPRDVGHNLHKSRRPRLGVEIGRNAKANCKDTISATRKFRKW